MTALEGCLAELNRSAFGRLRDRVIASELLEPGPPPKPYFSPSRLRGEMEQHPTNYLKGETHYWTKEEVGRITFHMKRHGKTPTLLLRTLQVLFKYGIDANTKPGFFGTALQIACFIRSETTERMSMEPTAGLGRRLWLLYMPEAAANRKES